MGAGRYELTEVQWGRIEPLLPGRVGTVGRTAVDNRLFVHTVLWVPPCESSETARAWRKGISSVDHGGYDDGAEGKAKAAQEVMQQYTQQARKESSDDNTMG